MQRLILPLLALIVVLGVALGSGRGGAATQPTTISDIRVTNLSANAFTVSWMTNSAVGGSVRYGTAADQLTGHAEDARGAATSSRLHYVLVGGLTPETAYHFEVLSDGMVGNDGGIPFTVTTGPTLTPTPGDTIYGRVAKHEGDAVTEAIVYFTFETDTGAVSSQPLSALVQSSTQGYWSFVSTNARSADLSAPFSSSGNTRINESAFDDEGDTGTLTTTIGDADDFATAPTLSVGIPTAVQLARFQATAQETGVLVEWETVTEVNNVGFNLYRNGENALPGAPLNDELFPSQAPGSSQGFAYEWLDETVEPGHSYFYWLEDVDVEGNTSLHGPISVSLQIPTAVMVDAVGAGQTATSPYVVLIIGGLALIGLKLRRRGHRTTREEVQA